MVTQVPNVIWEDFDDYSQDEPLEDHRVFLQRLRARQPSTPNTTSVRVEDLETSKQLRCTVQLLHQSVNDYLLQPEIMSLLFSRAMNRNISRPIENGHVFILRLYLQLMKLSPKLRRPLREARACVSHWDHAEWTVVHAPRAERTSKVVELGDLLDSIDQHLIMTEGITWPASAFVFQRFEVLSWEINFLAYAVSQNMQAYVRSRLDRDKKLVNSKSGRPWLFFSMWSPEASSVVDPIVVEILLDSGAEAKKRWEDGDSNFKDALQSMSYLPTSCNHRVYPHREIIAQLLRAGADANGIPGGVISVLHSIIKMMMDPGPKMDLLETCKTHGANFRIKDHDKREILDVFFASLYGRDYSSLRQESWQFHSSFGSEMTAPDAFSFESIQWLFNQGAVISDPRTYAHLSFRQSLLYQDEFRKPGIL